MRTRYDRCLTSARLRSALLAASAAGVFQFADRHAALPRRAANLAYRAGSWSASPAVRGNFYASAALGGASDHLATTGTDLPGSGSLVRAEYFPRHCRF